MKKLKQILASFIMLVFVVSQGGINTSFAETNNNASLVKQVVVAKHDLGQMKNGKKYIDQVDALVEKYKNNETVLRKLSAKSEQVFAKIPNPKTASEKRVVAIFEYLNAKVELELYSLYKQAILEERLKESEEEKKEQQAEKKADEILAIIDDSSLSENDKKKVEDKLVKIQKNVFESGSKKIVELKEEFQAIYNQKQSGDLSIDFMMQEGDDKAKMNLLLKGYEAIQHNFDSQINSEIDMFFELIEGDDMSSIEASGEVSIVGKNGMSYISIDNADINVDSDDDDITEPLDMIKKIAQENGYIQIEDDEAEEIMELLESLNFNALLEQGNDISSTAMLKAYKKQGELYSLVPTKHFCESAKMLMSKFDPFYGSTCSDSQYEDMLKDFVKQGELTLDLSNNITSVLKFESNNIDYNLELHFTDTKIKALKIDSSVEDAMSVSLSFKDQEHLKYESNVQGYNIRTITNFDSQLDRNNNFKYIDLKHEKVSESQYVGDTTMTLSLKNRNLSGKYIAETKEYDYENSKYINGPDFVANISGKTDFANTLSELNINYNNNSTIQGNLSYKENSIDFNHDFSSERSKVSINAGGKYSETEELITDLHFKMSAEEKGYTYDQETWKIIYDEEFSPMVDINLDVQNKNIDLDFKLYSDKKEFFNINGTGSYSKKYFLFDALYSIGDEKFNGTGNLNIDFKNNKPNYSTNILFNLDAQGYDGEVDLDIEFKLQDNSRIDYGEFPIEMPKSIKKLSDLIDM